VEEFLIEDSIEKKPTILGVKSVFFFVFAVVTIIVLFTVFTVRTFTAFLIGIVVLGILYIYLWIKTNDFTANKSTDKKVPNIINCNPDNESKK